MIRERSSADKPSQNARDACCAAPEQGALTGAAAEITFRAVSPRVRQIFILGETPSARRSAEKIRQFLDREASDGDQIRLKFMYPGTHGELKTLAWAIGDPLRPNEKTGELIRGEIDVRYRRAPRVHQTEIQIVRVSPAKQAETNE